MQLIKDIFLAHLPFGTLSLVEYVSKKTGKKSLGTVAGVFYYLLFFALLVIVFFLSQDFFSELTTDHSEWVSDQNDL